MARGFVFVQGNEIPLRFFHNHAFRCLEEKYDLEYVALRPENGLRAPGLDEAIARINKPVHWIGYDPNRGKKWKELFNVSCIAYKERSPSFAIRERENHAKMDEGKYRRLRQLARPGLFEEYYTQLERELGLNQEMLALTFISRPDFFILPSTLMDRMTDDVLQLQDALNIPTLLLTAGWDNLSSKGLLQRKPVMTGVFGEQTVEHAVAVQGLPRASVFPVGAPHYDNFRRAADDTEKIRLRRKLNLPPNVRILLFAGTLRLFDETTALRELDDAIEAGQLGAVFILYRPHPDRVTRESEEPFENIEWRHVGLDPEMRDYYAAHKRGEYLVPENYFERIGYLTKIYKVVDAVISPMSSILLESLLVGLPAMAVAFGDGKHSWSADKVSGMMHFREMFDIPELLVCRSRNHFMRDAVALVERIGDEGLAVILRERSRYFISRDERPYAERVLELVEKMMAEVTDPPRYHSVRRPIGQRLVNGGRCLLARLRASLTG